MANDKPDWSQSVYSTGGTIDVTGSNVNITAGTVTISGTPPVKTIAPPYTSIATVSVGGQTPPYFPAAIVLTQDIVGLAFRWKYSIAPASPPLLQLVANVQSPSSLAGSVATMQAGPVVGDQVVVVANNGDSLLIGYDLSDPANGSADFPANLEVEVLAISAPQSVIAEPPMGLGPSTGQVTIAATDTPQVLTSTWYGVNYGTRVRADAGNANILQLGGHLLGTETGEVLQPGDVATQPSPPHALWISGTSGDKVSWFAT